MNPRINSLWSTDIKPGILSPLDILETQVFALREQTDGLLTAEVRANPDNAEGAVYLLLDIVVPSLNGSRHRILTARYFAERIYPCHVDAEALRSAEAAYSDEEFRELVRQVLHSGEVKALALSLIARVRDQRKPSPLPLERRDLGHKRLFRPAWAGVESEGEEITTTTDNLYDERAAGD